MRLDVIRLAKVPEGIRAGNRPRLRRRWRERSGAGRSAFRHELSAAVLLRLLAMTGLLPSETLVALASALDADRASSFKEGRSLEHLGLAGRTAGEVRRVFELGPTA